VRDRIDWSAVKVGDTFWLAGQVGWNTYRARPITVDRVTVISG
jgi:hypothetical protein